MTREDEVLQLLEASPSEDIFDKHSQLEEAEQVLSQNWTIDRQGEYNHILTELNFTISENTGLTDPRDLAIAREIISVAHDERRYEEHTRGCEFSDSD